MLHNINSRNKVLQIQLPNALQILGLAIQNPDNLPQVRQSYKCVVLVHPYVACHPLDLSQWEFTQSLCGSQQFPQYRVSRECVTK